MNPDVTDGAGEKLDAGTGSAPPRPRKHLTRVWKYVLAGAILSWLGYEFLTLPFGDVEKLRSHNPRQTEFMRLHAERARKEGKPFHKAQEWTPLKDVPTAVINAVVVAEDGRFWSHHGIDWFELKESILKNISQVRAARGASTITQQLVKNLYLSPSKNPLRKFREWVLTWWMERTLRKSRILELYLNVIEWGNGIYGVQAASREYFGKNVTELTREEAARLAAIIPSPRSHRPEGSSMYVIRRAGLILQRMAARGM
ncbi:MAG: monofunctional biosynthetic peptidoglycan transglycosylase [Bacteroidota bacterium]